MEDNVFPFSGDAGSSLSDAQLLAELEAQGFNLNVLKFYRWLYERGLIEPPARISRVGSILAASVAPPKAA